MKLVRYIILCLLFYFLFIPVFSYSEENITFNRTVIHNLKITFYPEERRFSAEDTIIVPEHLLPEFQFFLHKGLNPYSPSSDVIISVNQSSQDIPHESYSVKLPIGVNTFVLKYGGTIHNPSLSGKKKLFNLIQAQGIISEVGIYLAGSSFWYPVFNGELVKFSLLVELPSEWDAISQGERTLHRKDNNFTYVRWESNNPQEEIFLIGSRFMEYSRSMGKVIVMVFLRTPDKGLADQYLDAITNYINMYESLIGEYPYKKFAVVENMWEFGYGMPSFTVIGPKFIRLPYALSTFSLHEVLHTWWGNSVFPDYERGNWSEGLTGYLSDHLLKEQQNEDSIFRLRLLQSYSEYLLTGKDSPISAFQLRTGSFAEPIGYGKSLMFFHMLRLQLGDRIFTDAIRDFYQKHKFQRATFADILRSFEKVAKRGLKKEFEQWITRPGAPILKLSDVKINKEKEGYTLSAVIEQKQHGKFNLNVPIAVTMKDKEKAYQTTIKVDKKKVEFKLFLPHRPVRLDVDPEFDVFRKLERDEIPPVISQVIGAEKIVAILPSSADKNLLKAYRKFAINLAVSGSSEIDIKLDNEVSSLPNDSFVIVFGLENKYASKVFNSLSKYKVVLNHKLVKIGRTEIMFENNTIVLAARNPDNEILNILFVFSNVPEGLLELGRNLSRFSGFSYVGFEGKNSINIIKGRWNFINSPLTVFIPDENGEIMSAEIGELLQRSPLITLQNVFSEEAIMQTIRFLSSEELKGRGLGTEEIDKAAQYIAEKFQEAGLRPGGDKGRSYFQTFEDWFNDEKTSEIVLKNVVGIIPGRKPEWSGQSIVIGAHYDHLGTECVKYYDDENDSYCPGANDNASGVAVLIELARVINKSLNPDRTIIFVAFTNEEKGKSGSRYFVKNMKEYPPDKCIGMINIDTVGQIKKNKIYILNSTSAKQWQYILRNLSWNVGLDLDFVTEELDVSDQIAFHNAGIPAIQLFSGPHPDYHQTTDTADKINSAGLIKTALLLKLTIEKLSTQEEFLTK